MHVPCAFPVRKCMPCIHKEIEYAERKYAFCPCLGWSSVTCSAFTPLCDPQTLTQTQLCTKLFIPQSGLKLSVLCPSPAPGDLLRVPSLWLPPLWELRGRDTVQPSSCGALQDVSAFTHSGRCVKITFLFKGRLTLLCVHPGPFGDPFAWWTFALFSLWLL